MDGTLIDSEPYWIAEEFALVGEFGGTWSEAQAAALVGSDLLVSGRILRDAGVALPPEAIVERLLDGVIRRIQERIPWRPGARELLASVAAAGLPSVLVTMSYRRFAEVVVASLPPGSFRAVVAGDDVARGKPYPDPYLQAADAVHVAPARAVALEDSPTGVASALAAGVPTVAIPHVAAVPARPGLSRVRSLADLSVPNLRKINQGQVIDTIP
jgi:HAD superfamily hydrolase (TIGR01509 family)